MQLLCSWCNSSKPESEFVKRVAKEPYSQKNVRCCRECNRSKNKDRYHGDPEVHRKQAEATRRWAKRNNASVLASHKKYADKNGVKRKAKEHVRNAIKSGRLQRLPCVVCSRRDDVHGHHDSYEPERWLDVRWLCRDHHQGWHIVLDQLKVNGEGKRVIEAAFIYFRNKHLTTS